MNGLIDALEGDSHQKANALCLLPAEEKERLLHEFNATESRYEEEKLIQELFEEKVREQGGEVAVIFAGRSLSYGELNRKANQVAHYLLALGIKKEDRVAICMERSVEMVIGLLGILKAGGTYVPLDPDYPEDRLMFMVEDSVPVALITQEAQKERFASLPMPVLSLDKGNDALVLIVPSIVGIHVSGCKWVPLILCLWCKFITIDTASTIKRIEHVTDCRTTTFASLRCFCNCGSDRGQKNC